MTNLTYAQAWVGYWMHGEPNSEGLEIIRRAQIMPDHTTTSAAAYLAERGYKVHSKRDGTDLSPTPGTVKQWCERGKIKARKAGWVWLIPQEALDALLTPPPRSAQGGREED